MSTVACVRLTVKTTRAQADTVGNQLQQFRIQIIFLILLVWKRVEHTSEKDFRVRSHNRRKQGRKHERQLIHMRHGAHTVRNKTHPCFNHFNQRVKLLL